MTFKINIPAVPDIIDTFIPVVSAWKSKEIHHVWIRAFIFRTYSTFVAGSQSWNCAVPQWESMQGLQTAGFAPLGPGANGRSLGWGLGGLLAWGGDGCEWRWLLQTTFVYLSSFFLLLFLFLNPFHTCKICFLFPFPCHATLVLLGLSHPRIKIAPEIMGLTPAFFLKEQKHS